MELLKKWWSLLEEEGGKNGYYVNEKKLKHIKISTEGHRHLGLVIGIKQFSVNYISSLISQWCEEITDSSADS